MAREGQDAMIDVEVFQERGVSKMARTSGAAMGGRKAPPKRLKTMTKVVEVAPVEEPYIVQEELPFDQRLKRQREIIHARRGEMKSFLSPRQTPYKPLRTTLQMVGTPRPHVRSPREEMIAREQRLKRQREIIHARRGELKRFLRPTATG
jgi:hypothetical protein